ncbi:MAG: hypothetical protein IJ400_07175 [Clostridia bacterium]|nr:hypothetical protein [Clostridia bacterium]
MKRTICICLVLVMVLLCFFSCGKSSFDKAVDHLKRCGLESMEYDQEQINNIISNISTSKVFALEGKIARINHCVKSQIDGSLKWAYLYEFELESDATNMLRYAELMGEYCISKGSIVVYGNAPEIEGIEL